MQRLGKIVLDREIVMGDYAIELFRQLEFVPYRAELMAHSDQFEYIGTSPWFAPLEKGLYLPTYEVEIYKNSDNTITVFVPDGAKG